MRLLIAAAFIATTAFGQAYRWDYLNEMGRQEFAKPPSRIATWPTDEGAAREISREQIAAFLTRAGIVKSADDVHDFRFVHLTPGKTYLAAVVYAGGNQPPNQIELVHCDEKLCTADGLSSDPEIDLSEQLVSITGDGIFQIVTIEGSSFHIYEMGEKAPHEASRKYRDWYNRNLYPKMEEAIKAGPKVFAPEVDDTAFVAAFREADGQYTLDEYRERVLGVKDAPMEHALEWAKSPYWRIQSLALSAVQWAEDSRLVEQVLDALEKSYAEHVRTDAFEIRKERAERRAEKERKQ